jgi:hypothetical protein
MDSKKNFPKKLQRWRTNASQQQILWCTVSVSKLQNAQFGSPSKRPIILRCFFTGASPVRNAFTFLSWSVLNLRRSSARSMEFSYTSILLKVVNDRLRARWPGYLGLAFGRRESRPSLHAEDQLWKTAKCTDWHHWIRTRNRGRETVFKSRQV